MRSAVNYVVFVIYFVDQPVHKFLDLFDKPQRRFRVRKPSSSEMHVRPLSVVERYRVPAAVVIHMMLQKKAPARGPGQVNKREEIDLHVCRSQQSMTCFTQHMQLDNFPLNSGLFV